MAKPLTLAQTIARQKRLEQKLFKIYIQLTTNVKSVENRPPKHNPDDLIKLASRLIGDIVALKQCIHCTYDETLLTNGMPLWYALIEQQRLQEQQEIDKEYEWQQSLLNSPIKFFENLDNVFEFFFQEMFEREMCDNNYHRTNKLAEELETLSNMIHQSLNKTLLM